MFPVHQLLGRPCAKLLTAHGPCGPLQYTPHALPPLQQGMGGGAGAVPMPRTPEAQAQRPPLHGMVRPARRKLRFSRLPELLVMGGSWRDAVVLSWTCFQIPDADLPCMPAVPEHHTVVNGRLPVGRTGHHAGGAAVRGCSQHFRPQQSFRQHELWRRGCWRRCARQGRAALLWSPLVEKKKLCLQ